MNKKQRMQRIGKELGTWIALGSFMALAIFVSVAAWNVYHKAELTRENADRINARLTELQSRESDLSASVAALNSEFGVEAEIRDKYGFTKEGEEVVVIIEGESESAPVAEEPQQKGFWETILGIF